VDLNTIPYARRPSRGEGTSDASWEPGARGKVGVCLRGGVGKGGPEQRTLRTARAKVDSGNITYARLIAGPASNLAGGSSALALSCHRRGRSASSPGHCRRIRQGRLRARLRSSGVSGKVPPRLGGSWARGLDPLRHLRGGHARSRAPGVRGPSSRGSLARQGPRRLLITGRSGFPCPPSGFAALPSLGACRPTDGHDRPTAYPVAPSGSPAPPSGPLEAPTDSETAPTTGAHALTARAAQRNRGQHRRGGGQSRRAGGQTGLAGGGGREDDGPSGNWGGRGCRTGGRGGRNGGASERWGNPALRLAQGSCICQLNRLSSL
jgi:hypothetical protein